MTNKINLTVLEGGYGKKLHSGYHFIEAHATNTRLMGVVGIVVKWQKSENEYFHELYHLDFESYGIDGYEGYVNPTEEFLDHRIRKMMGGLGGTFEVLEAREVRALLQSAVQVAPECLGEFPEIEEAFPNIAKDMSLSDENYDEITARLTPALKNQYALIHYFMMRSIGQDWSGRRGLWLEVESNYDTRDMTLVPSTLIRESIQEVDKNTYQVTSLIDGYSGYDMVVSEIKLSDIEGELKVESFEMIRKMKISSIEAAMMLKKKEFLSIYTVLDETIEIDLENNYPEMMDNEHEAGVLYSRFKPTNSHVEEQVFYLSGDLLGLYYLTDEGQMIVSSFDEESLNQIENELSVWIGEKLIAPAGQFVIDVPILYDFVNSGFGDFFDFINAEE